LLFFSSGVYNVQLLINGISNFFLNKKFYFLISKINISSFYQGFFLFGWQVLCLKSDFLNVSLSLQSVQKHKSNLKNIFKLNFGSDIFSLIKKLNQIIYFWLMNFFYSDSDLMFFYHLDVFLYRLLWNFMRRIHPRRPQTWIFNKYWIYFDSFWHFRVYDPQLSKFLILSLHSSRPFSIIYSSLGFYFNSFEYLNRIKFYSIYLKSFLFFFNKLFVFLWKRQFGVCFICHQLFDFSKEVRFRLLSFSYSSFLFPKFVLVHDYCLFYL